MLKITPEFYVTGGITKKPVAVRTDTEKSIEFHPRRNNLPRYVTVKHCLTSPTLCAGPLFWWHHKLSLTARCKDSSSPIGTVIRELRNRGEIVLLLADADPRQGSRRYDPKRWNWSRYPRRGQHEESSMSKSDYYWRWIYPHTQHTLLLSTEPHQATVIFRVLRSSPFAKSPALKNDSTRVDMCLASCWIDANDGHRGNFEHTSSVVIEILARYLVTFSTVLFPQLQLCHIYFLVDRAAPWACWLQLKRPRAL